MVVRIPPLWGERVRRWIVRYCGEPQFRIACVIRLGRMFLVRIFSLFTSFYCLVRVPDSIAKNQEVPMRGLSGCAARIALLGVIAMLSTGMAVPVFGQLATGTILGLVKDASGAV